MKKQQQIVVWVLATVMMVNCLGTNLIYGLYMVDQDIFVELFCENTANPAMHCDGTCMLKKMASHDHQHSDQHSLLDVYKVQLVFYTPTILQAPQQQVTSVYHQFRYENHYAFQNSGQFFHPPILV